MVEDFIIVGEWLIDIFIRLWSFFGTAGFLGFGIIGFVVIRKLVYLFKKITI